ncbi:GIY-YIG nuclease family protein [Pseudidiomarina sp.]|uniref:GIY-YIG nuclease family protein n=1 Tax=Pseudidiomarina sp. TaxID=2081707 RepID=UPI003A98579E
MGNDIALNDLLNLSKLADIKFRFMTPHYSGDPLDIFKREPDKIDEWLLWNYAKLRSFKIGDTVFGFIRLHGDKWLLVRAVRITEDLNAFNGVGYQAINIGEYQKYLGRVIISYKNRAQKLIRNAATLIDECKVSRILENVYSNDDFPGYDNVRISWQELNHVIDTIAWKTALENQQAVYLITDRSNGKMYVGSATGDQMLYNRWKDYMSSGHGGNADLKKLASEHIKNNFYFSILDIYKSKVSKDVVINREQWWKKTLRTNIFGYNKN